MACCGRPITCCGPSCGRDLQRGRLHRVRPSRSSTGRTPAEREALVDSRARDGYALLAVLEGRVWGRRSDQAARSAGHGARPGPGPGRGRGVPDRPARWPATGSSPPSTPRPGTGTRPSTASFDGYKGHVAEDPDSEIVTATAVTAGNVGDAAAAANCSPRTCRPTGPEPPHAPTDQAERPNRPGKPQTPDSRGRTRPRGPPGRGAVYGDAAYGTGPLLAELDRAGVEVMVKVQAADRAAAGGSPRTPSPSICARAGDLPEPGDRPAPPGRRRAGPGSGRPARPARSPGPAPRPGTGASSASARTRNSWPAAAHAGRPGLAGRLPGHPTQGRTQDRPPDAAPARRTPGPGPRAAQESPPTSLCWPPPPTSPGSACSGWPIRAEPGSRPRAEQREGGPKPPPPVRAAHARPGWTDADQTIQLSSTSRTLATRRPRRPPLGSTGRTQPQKADKHQPPGLVIRSVCSRRCRRTWARRAWL